MRVAARIAITAPIDQVWSIVSDPTCALSFMSGVTRWEVASEQPTGLGARYRMLLRVGSAEVGGLIEVVEWDEPCELAWTSVTGIDQRGRFRLRRARLSAPWSNCDSPTASPAPGLPAGWPSGSRRPPSAVICSAACSSSSDSSSTSCCASAQPRAVPPGRLTPGLEPRRQLGARKRNMRAR